jgi:hypothetical protein
MCHHGIYDQFVRTAMGRSMSRPGADLLPQPATLHSEQLQRDFRVFRKNGDLYQSESQPGVFENVHKLEYAIGSGENGISFAVRRGAYLYQAPLSFYAKTGAWNLSPGFEQADEGFSRPIYDACITCHTGRLEAVPGRDGLYRDPPFAELAIGCENCHGPGQAHIAAKERGVVELPDPSIVNPARLPARLAEDICMLCHQGGDARVLLPSKQYSDFRPGTPLMRTVAVFGLLADLKEADLLEHHASMKLSRCFRASGGKLSCLTCHNPHQQPDSAGAPAYFRARCLRCHTERSCQLSLAIRRNNAVPDNCIACHMPKRDVEKISHSALTNHRIPARPGAPVSAPSPKEDLPGLLLLNVRPGEPPLPLLTRLAAYGELMDRDASLRPKYLELLDQASRSTPDDPLVLAALGRKALAEGKADAVVFLTRAEQKGAPSAATYVDLSQALAQAGRLTDSTAALERGERLFPYSKIIRKRLILAYIRHKAFSNARVSLERYVQDFPEDSFMRGLLDKVRRGAQR